MAIDGVVQSRTGAAIIAREAFFGGLALLGEPYSPARYSLVPGHMLLCGTLLGVLCFVIRIACSTAKK